MIRGIHHTALSTGNLERAIAFYRDVLGFELVMDHRWDAGRQLCDHGITHLCLEVDDIEAEHTRLSAAGMRFHHAPVQNDGAKMTYGRDPDGNVIELIEFQAKTESLAL